MDFAAFEHLALRVLFETKDPLTAPHLAYLAAISVQRAERFLARMVEQGTLIPRVGPQDTIEYILPGRRGAASARTSAEAVTDGAAEDAASGLESGEGETSPGYLEAAPASSTTVVLLSVLVPGAGHIYAGRSGAGVAWMATTLAGYACCLLPGLFLHGLCLVSAAHVRQAT